MKTGKWERVIKGNLQPVFFVFLAFFTMVMVSYLYVSRIVSDQTRMLGEEILDTTEAEVSANLWKAEVNFSYISGTMESMLSSRRNNEEILYFLESINEYFSAEDSLLPGFLSVYAYVDGEFLDGSGWVPPEDYVPEERPWYVGAQFTEEIYFSDPYLDADTGGICLSFSRTMADETGEKHGVLGIDMDLSTITGYINQLRLENNGYGILLNNSMMFVSHRDTSIVGRKMEEAGQGYGRLAQMLQEGQAVSAERFTDVDGTDSIAFLRPIFNGWYIGIVIPRFNYYRQVYMMGGTLSVLGLLLMSALSYLLVRSRYEKQKADGESRSKSDFLSRMSHEMRTPMNAIIGMTEIARKSEDKERIRYCLDKIGDASAHLLGVINDVLDMSKIEAGKLELSEEIFDLGAMVDQVVGVMQFKFKEKKQRFTCTMEEPLPGTIKADRQRLVQLINNLLSNATKFTPEEGSIDLNLRSLGREENHEKLQIEVKDSGIGISPLQQEKLFQSFEQADVSISRKYGGTGLGLSISKRILDLMGGEIIVESDLGKGSVFRFTVPVTVEELGAASAPEDTILAGKQEEKTNRRKEFAGKRILVVEDVEINREVLLAQLEDTGLIIDCAETGKEACTIFRTAKVRYDLIFMDIHMPEMDGYEATRQIRRMDMPDAKTIPIIAMTANVFREDVERCLAAGMNGHIGKPLDIQEVIGKLDQYL